VNLDGLRAAKTFDELILAAQKLNEDPSTDWAEVDVAVRKRWAEIEAAGGTIHEDVPPPADPPAPPAITLTQRNHYIRIDRAAPLEHSIEYQVKVDRAPWRSDREMLWGEHGICVPVGFRQVQLRARYDGDPAWGPVATVRQQERPRRVARSNPYWHYWQMDNREAFSQTCRNCAPGVNERDKAGDTIGHIIAGMAHREDVDAYGNFTDDRGWNRSAWIGSLMGDGDVLRGAGLDPSIRNRAGLTVADVWRRNRTEMSREDLRQEWAELLDRLVAEARG